MPKRFAPVIAVTQLVCGLGPGEGAWVETRSIGGDRIG